MSPVARQPGRRLAAAGILAAGMSAASIGLFGCADSAPGPSIVLVVIDTLRADRLGSYGHPGGATPALDRLASEGVRFARVVAVSPWTGPSTAAIVTGRYPDELGYEELRDPLPAAAVSLSQILAENGYATRAVISNSICGPAYGHDKGYEELVFEPYKSRDEEGRLLPNFTADRVTDAALEFWNGRDPARPLFLHVHYTDPHEPYLAPPEVRERFGVEPPEDMEYVLSRGYMDSRPSPEFAAWLERAYLAEVAFLDEHLGRLFDAVGDDAFLVVVSDHGEEFGEHRSYLHGHTLYEELLFVPLLMRGPGLPPGTVVDRLASHVDIAPTLLELSGARAPEGLPLSGISLVASWTGEQKGQRRLLAFLETRGQRWVVVRQGDWKYWSRPDDEEAILFHLGRDKGETQTVAGKHGDVVERLEQFLERRAGELVVVPRDEDPGGEAERLEALKAIGYAE